MTPVNYFVIALGNNTVHLLMMMLLLLLHHFVRRFSGSSRPLLMVMVRTDVSRRTDTTTST